MYRLTFAHRDQQAETVKIYPEVTLLHQTRHNAQAKFFNLVVSNLLSPNEDKLAHYLAKPKLSITKRTQRCPIAPIVFRSSRGLASPEHKFKVWTEWSYAETTRHVLLYWPQEFDFLTHYLFKMIGKKYEPQVLKGIYASTKSEKLSGEAVFYEVVLEGNPEWLPRWGSSPYGLDDQLYIFGGFYTRQAGYLSMQNDISTLDLTDFNPEAFEPRKLQLLNKELYAGEAFQGRLREGRTPHSFVRPRMEGELFEMGELAGEQ